jgi:hypothetical protein
MARIKGKDLYLKDDDQIYFGDNQEGALWYLDSELQLNHTISGTAATAGYHLIRKDQVDLAISAVASGIGVEIYTPGDFLEGQPNAPGIATAGPLSAYVFDDNINENLYATFVVPEDWKVNSDIIIKIGYMNDSAQTGTNNVVWRFMYHTYESGQSYASKSTTTLSLTSSLPNNSIAGYFKSDTFTVLQYNHANNPFNAGTMIPFQLQRQATNGSDTVTGDAALLMLIFVYETEAG